MSRLRHFGESVSVETSSNQAANLASGSREDKSNLLKYSPLECVAFQSVPRVAGSCDVGSRRVPGFARTAVCGIVVSRVSVESQNCRGKTLPYLFQLEELPKISHQQPRLLNRHLYFSGSRQDCDKAYHHSSRLVLLDSYYLRDSL